MRSCHVKNQDVCGYLRASRGHIHDRPVDYVYVTGNIPELATKPWEIGLHLAAEATTAVLLIAAGYGLLTKRTWSFWMFLFSMGMLVYTLIVSPGYFPQRGEIGFAVIFFALIILTKAFIVPAFMRPSAFTSDEST